MSVKHAHSFLQKLEEDKDLRAKLLEIAELENVIKMSLAKQEKLKAEIAKDTGFKFTKEELFEAIGVPDFEITKEAEDQLRALDIELRKKGLQGVNPLAYSIFFADACE
jgi:predicted ribosomally synthesized peptide with nif11-like leader